MNITIAFGDGTIKSVTADGMPESREGGQLAYRVECDMRIDERGLILETIATAEERVGTVAENGRNATTGGARNPYVVGAAARGEASQRNGEGNRSVDTAVLIDCPGSADRSLDELAESFTERGGIARIDVDDDTIWPS